MTRALGWICVHLCRNNSSWGISGLSIICWVAALFKAVLSGRAIFIFFDIFSFQISPILRLPHSEKIFAVLSLSAFVVLSLLDLSKPKKNFRQFVMVEAGARRN